MNKSVPLNSPAGYGPVTPLDKTRHAGLGLKAGLDYRWCADLNAMAVSVAEFARAALDYPLAFVRDPGSGRPLPIAVLGFQQQNLFVDAQGRWRAGTYVPAYVRRFPFCIADMAAQGDQPEKRLVCMQEDRLEPSAQPLFDDKGEPTAAWKPIQTLLEAIEGARPQTRLLGERLEALQLLTSFDALALPRGGQHLRLQGLFRVDEDKLRKLPAKDLRELLAKGYLRAAYAHLLSLENFARLLDLAQEQSAAPTQGT